VNVYWRHCRIAQRDHREHRRQYAHTFHYPNTICLAKEFWGLPKPYRDGILLHEIGHMLVGPEGTEKEATAAAEEFYGVEIDYVDSPYGRNLERLWEHES
jgi:hypothetical protein